MADILDVPPKNSSALKKPALIAGGIVVLLLIIFIIVSIFKSPPNNEEVLSENTESETTAVVEDKEEDEDKSDFDESGIDSAIRRFREESASDGEEDTTNEDTEDEEEVVEEKKYADLYVHEYTLSETPEINEEFTVHLEFVNDGDKIAEDFEWEWWADDGELGCDGDIDELEPGEKETVECEYTYEEEGDYETYVVVDSGDDVDESDEDNNDATRTIEIEEKLADLTVTGYTFSENPVKGESFTISIAIKNQGDADAENFYWEWKPTWALTACREEISIVEAGDTEVVICPYTYGGCSTYDTKAIIDADNDVEESNETNNERSEQKIVPCNP